MTHASLFSGIGGFDLAAEWAGWTNAFNCEIDPFCRRVLKYHFPHATQYEDIRTTDFTVWRNRIDVLTGGFPCQPFSLAGKRKGTEDERYLWPEMLRVIRTVRPRWVVGENVYGIVNCSAGLVLEQVCADLEAAGYAVQPYIIPACGVNAPHRRDRVWFVAHLTEDTECIRCYGDKPEEEPHAGRFGKSCAGDHVRVCSSEGIITHRTNAGAEAVRERENGICAAGVAADADGLRLPVCGPARNGRRRPADRSRIPNWDSFPTQSPVCRGDDGFPGGLDGITFPAWCKESIKVYGNAIVLQVALQIFKTINHYV